MIDLLISSPGQCCGDGWCVEDLDMHGVERSEAECTIRQVTKLINQARNEFAEIVEAAIPRCYLWRNSESYWEQAGVPPVTCLDLVGATWGDHGTFTAGMCCNSCKVRGVVREAVADV